MVRESSGERSEERLERLERWISYLLIAGVMLSLVLEVAGIILYFLASGSAAVSRQAAVFVRGRNFFAFLAAAFYEVVTGPGGLRLMLLGIAILILTPYLRAAMSVAYFASIRDFKYLFITLFVLAVLTLSLLFH